MVVSTPLTNMSSSVGMIRNPMKMEKIQKCSKAPTRLFPKVYSSTSGIMAFRGHIHHYTSVSKWIWAITPVTDPLRAPLEQGRGPPRWRPSLWWLQPGATCENHAVKMGISLRDRIGVCNVVCIYIYVCIMDYSGIGHHQYEWELMKMCVKMEDCTIS